MYTGNANFLKSNLKYDHLVLTLNFHPVWSRFYYENHMTLKPNMFLTNIKRKILWCDGNPHSEWPIQSSTADKFLLPVMI